MPDDELVGIFEPPDIAQISHLAMFAEENEKAVNDNGAASAFPPPVRVVLGEHRDVF